MINWLIYEFFLSVDNFFMLVCISLHFHCSVFIVFLLSCAFVLTSSCHNNKNDKRYKSNRDNGTFKYSTSFFSYRLNFSRVFIKIIYILSVFWIGFSGKQTSNNLKSTEMRKVINERKNIFTVHANGLNSFCCTTYRLFLEKKLFLLLFY